MLTTLLQGVEGGKWFRLFDKVFAERNLWAALQQVAKNKGASGVDHVTVEEFARQLPENIWQLSDALQAGTFVPQAIRRLFYPILEDDQHPDRHHIEPNPHEVIAARMQGDNFAWRISEEFLAREVVTKERSKKDKPVVESGDVTAMQEVVSLLREQLQQSHGQLQVKDQQIAALAEMMKSLNERLREGNILMGSLQKQLTLGEGKETGQGSARSVTSVEATSEKAEESKPRDAKSAAAKKPKAKPTLWVRVFG